MATKLTYDFENRLLIISGTITEIDVQVDLYSDWKEDVINNVFNPGVFHPFRTTAGDPLGPGIKISPYFFLINGWKIRPSEEDHTLTIRGNLFTDPAGLDIVIPTLGDFTVNAIIERAVDSTAILLDEVIVSQSLAGGDHTTIITSQSFAEIDHDSILISQSLADGKLDTLIGAGGSLTPSQSIMLTTLYELMGLDPTKPLVVTPVARTVTGSFSQSIDFDGTTATVTRDS